MMITTTAQIEKDQDARNGLPARYLVKVEGRLIGMVEKCRSTRTVRHPYKAWNVSGSGLQMFANFYEKNGMDLAVAAILTKWEGR